MHKFVCKDTRSLAYIENAVRMLLSLQDLLDAVFDQTIAAFNLT
jgi:hypothetical protein